MNFRQVHHSTTGCGGRTWFNPFNPPKIHHSLSPLEPSFSPTPSQKIRQSFYGSPLLTWNSRLTLKWIVHQNWYHFYKLWRKVNCPMINILLILNWALQGRLDKKKGFLIFLPKITFWGKNQLAMVHLLSKKSRISLAYIFKVKIFDRDFTSWSYELLFFHSHSFTFHILFGLF